MHVYPGTEIEKIAREKGIVPSDFTWTRENDPRVITLPPAQGYAPPFIDQLSWAQIRELLFRWSLNRQGYTILNKILEVLKRIRTYKDLKRYIIMALVYFRLKLKKIGKPFDIIK